MKCDQSLRLVVKGFQTVVFSSREISLKTDLWIDIDRM